MGKEIKEGFALEVVSVRLVRDAPGAIRAGLQVQEWHMAIPGFWAGTGTLRLKSERDGFIRVMTCSLVPPAVPGWRAAFRPIISGLQRLLSILYSYFKHRSQSLQPRLNHLF